MRMMEIEGGEVLNKPGLHITGQPALWLRQGYLTKSHAPSSPMFRPSPNSPRQVGQTGEDE